jgi:hypothetical protein
MYNFLHELSDWIIALSSLGALVLAVINQRGIADNRRATTEIHLSMNSRLDQLVKMTSKSAHAEGRAEGFEAGRQEQK